MAELLYMSLVLHSYPAAFRVRSLVRAISHKLSPCHQLLD